MRVSGSTHIDARRPDVWLALGDPAVVARSLPGCETYEPIEPRTHAVTVTTGVASTHGTYRGTVQVTDVAEPERCRMRVQVAGDPGTVRADVVVTLDDDGAGTHVGYEVDAVVTGTLSAVGRRVLAGAVSRVVEGFLVGVERHLAGGAVVADDRVEVVPATAEEPRPDLVPAGAEREPDADPSPRRRAWTVSAGLGALAAIVGAVVRRRARRDGRHR